MRPRNFTPYPLSIPFMTARAATLDHAPDSVSVAPVRPDAPGVPFPHVADDAVDEALAEVTAARAAPLERALLLVRAVSVVAAVLLAFALRHDLRYAMSPSTPQEISVGTGAAELDALSHRLVALRAVPGAVGGVDYRRPTAGVTYRLAPLVDRADIYVELVIPDGVDPSRFVPPTTLRGRLVPLDDAGVRFQGARSLLGNSIPGQAVPARAFLLEHGAEPSPRSPGAVVAGLALLIGAVQAAFLVAQLRRTAS